MKALEKKATLSLGLIFACRMLGMFIILPVFSPYAANLPGATPFLIGMAIGIYGLTQASLQIPFGMLSDYFGRKPIIFCGLSLFIMGSIVAALSDSITGIIIGRGLQGAGAVGSTIIAFVADLTSEKNRTKAMAMIGALIGLSFMSAMVIGPVFAVWFHVSGLFWLTASLGFLAIFVLFYLVPSTTYKQLDTSVKPGQFKAILTSSSLLKLDFGIFTLHAILTASFVVIPFLLTKQLNLAVQHQWILYLSALVISFAIMLPMIILAEKKQKGKMVFLAGISFIFISQLGLAILPVSLIMISINLFVFFTGFNLLEATLPSMISKIAPARSKGTAMGVYSCSQFFGIFVGGSLGGWLYGQHHYNSVFITCSLLALLWFLIVLKYEDSKFKRK